MSGLARLRKLVRRVRAPGLLEKPWTYRYDEAATAEDILACFRLLLGRYPHVEEWTGHRMHVGEKLPLVVTSYLTSLEFARRGLSREMPAEITATDLPAFKIYSDVNDGAVGKFVRDGNYEHDVTAVFRRLLRPGMRVLDIGANIGYFSLLSARLVGATGFVHAVEPNRRNVVLLEASRRANGFDQIGILPFAAGAAAGMLALTTSHSTGTTSEPPDELSSLLGARIVPCVALDTVIPADAPIDLIKIDVDGAEYRAMRGCEAIVARDRPMVITEFAPDLLPGISGVDAMTYLRWFETRGYALAVIEPDGSTAAQGQEPADIIAAYQRRAVTHIDLLGWHREGTPPPR